VGKAKRAHHSLTERSQDFRHVSTPIRGQFATLHISVKTAMRPIDDAGDATVLDRVEMNVIDMAFKIGVVANGNGTYDFYGANSSKSVLTTGTLDDPGATKKSVSITGVPKKTFSYLAGGPVYEDPYSGARLMLYHAEQGGKGKSFYSMLGMAISTDPAHRQFRDLGVIIKPTLSSGNAEVGGGSFAIINGYLNVYFTDWTAKVIKPATVGIMYLNVSEDIAAKDVATKELQKYNIKVVANVAQEWDSPDESQHVLAMRTANPDFILSFSWPAPVAKFMHDANAQHWAPPMGYAANHLTGDPGYGPIFGDYIKDKTYTITSWGVPTDPSDTDNAEGGNTPEQQLMRDELIRTNGREYQGFKWRYAGYHHITQSGWVCTRILAKAAEQLGADLTRDGFKKVLESKGWDSGIGSTLYWNAADHNAGQNYSYNREFIYKWISAKDGGWDLKRILPDPVYDCAAGNIPPAAKTICHSWPGETRATACDRGRPGAPGPATITNRALSTN